MSKLCGGSGIGEGGGKESRRRCKPQFVASSLARVGSLCFASWNIAARVCVYVRITATAPIYDSAVRTGRHVNHEH